MNWLIFVVLAAFGAALRLVLTQGSSRIFTDFHLPLGTLAANAIGAFLIGWIYSLNLQGKFFASQTIYLILAIAFLGSLTTFSTFAIDTIKLFQGGYWGWGGANIILTNLICLGLCYLGIKLGSAY